MYYVYLFKTNEFTEQLNIIGILTHTKRMTKYKKQQLKKLYNSKKSCYYPAILDNKKELTQYLKDNQYNYYYKVIIKTKKYLF